MQGFLFIKIGTNDVPGGIIHSDVELGFGISKPQMEGSIHLKHFTEIRAPGTPWMGIF